MFYSKKIILLTSILFVQIIFCMEGDLSEKLEQLGVSEKSTKEDKSLDLLMKKITSCGDLIKFYGTVVAFKSGTTKLSSDPKTINYGYISRPKFPLCVLPSLDVLRLNSEELGHSLSLEKIKTWSLTMRHLTWDEIKKLKNLIDSGWRFSKVDTQQSCYSKIFNIKNLLSINEKRKAAFESSPGVRCILLGIKYSNSPFSQLPKDIYMLIIKLVMDGEIEDAEKSFNL